MSQDAKLRLCPLCGSDKIKVDTLSDDCFKSGWWLVWCDQKQGGCSDASITRKTKEEAIFGWNNFHCWKLLAEKEKELAELKNSPRSANKEVLEQHAKDTHRIGELMLEIESERKRKNSVLEKLNKFLGQIDPTGTHGHINSLRAEIQEAMQSPAAPEQKSNCEHKNTWFSRTIELCEHGIEGMHDYCNDCGRCVDQVPAADEKREGL